MGTRLREAGRSVRPPDDAFERLTRRRARATRNRRIGAVVVALGVSAGVLGGMVAALVGEGPATGDRRRLGASGGTDPRLALATGDYFYERYVLVEPDGADGYSGGTTEIETWWGWDGSGRYLLESDSEAYPPRESRTWRAGESPTDEDLSGLSTDPGTLERQLSERSSPGGASPQPAVTPGVEMDLESGRIWRAVEALLEMPSAVPELRVALFEVASGLQGVETVRGTSDAVGRTAVALRIETPGGGTVEWFFDPQTLQPMGRRGTYADGTYHRIVLDAGIAPSTAERPKAEDRFFPPPATALPELSEA